MPLLTYYLLSFSSYTLMRYVPLHYYQTAPSVLDCNERALNYVPPGYEEASCTEQELRSDNPIKQCCEQSNNAYLCTTCGSCAGENTAGNLASPGQLLIRENSFNETCCSYQNSGRGFYHYRNGTTQVDENGDHLTCDGNDDAECCKVGNGNEPQKYACFETTELDDTEPPVNNDDVSPIFGFYDDHLSILFVW